MNAFTFQILFRKNLKEFKEEYTNYGITFFIFIEDDGKCLSRKLMKRIDFFDVALARVLRFRSRIHKLTIPSSDILPVSKR